MSAKLCKDCVHCRAETFAGDDFSECTRPMRKADLVTGKPRWRYCSTHREIPWILAVLFGACGASGRWFIAKADGEQS